MAKKDFTQNAGRVYDAIAEATAEQAQEEQAFVSATDTQKASKKRKARKEYTEQEAQVFLNNMNTAGKKGVALPRINMAFHPTNYAYIETMSRASGITLTAFVNMVLDEHRAAHADIYQKALEFRAILEGKDKE